MNTIRQRLRPKHQILILKCYPRIQRTSANVKPNSSELSYLLYYASTRRSKLQKVGAFLEKKTERDVYKGRLGNIQVTLQIVTALIEKCPRDLPLYISTVFYVLDEILKSHDINLVEASVPTFGVLCTHYDNATLAADQEHTRHYDTLIQTYASFASRSNSVGATGRTANRPESIRYRSAGLQAIKSLVSSDSFNADTGKHLNVVMPVILENVYSDHADYLSLLRFRESNSEQQEKEQHNRLRQSFSVQRSAEEPQADPSVATGTAADVDQRADQDVGVLALQSLRQICSADNRGQIRLATTAIVNFVLTHPAAAQRRSVSNPEDASWATELFEMLCRWTPVQNRFVVLVTLTEALIRNPVKEDALGSQLELTRIIGWLLRSNINFIGLSVMDVLIGLIQHILALLQLGSNGSGIDPHAQQAINLPGNKLSGALPTRDAVVIEVVTTASTPRKQLLDQLHHCVGELATHVYYSDQIGDMLSAILLRLKPSQASAIPTAAAAVEDPAGAADAIANSVNLSEQSGTDGFFSFETARVLALQAVTDILEVANSRQKQGANAVGRNCVDISVWDGTQWLLRDPDGRVRKAYIGAFLTWLQLECDRKQLNVQEASDSATRANKKKYPDLQGSIVKRAASNASQRAWTQSQKQTSFLELLHLAIYENALKFANSEFDVLLLHLLQVTLVKKLGVNSIRIGLPMIFTLQEEVRGMESLRAKVAIGSLVHGYLWILSEIFEFKLSIPGLEIHEEIARRSNNSLWLNSIRVPPVPLEQIGGPPDSAIGTASNEPYLEHPLLPFDDRQGLVDAIAENYAQTVMSPPTSPQPSAVRSFSVPSPLSSSGRPGINVKRSLPSSVTTQMLQPWTKEACLAAAGTQGKAKASSMGGGSGNHRNFLGVLNGDVARKGSSAGSSTYNLSGSPQSATAPELPIQKRAGRHASLGSSRTRLTTSSANYSVVHVADLKRVLEGSYVPQLSSGPNNKGLDSDLANEDTASESMTSASDSSDGSGSDVTSAAIGTAVQGHVINQNTARDEPYQAIVTHTYSYVPGEDDDIPPVPQLPASMRNSSMGLGPLPESGPSARLSVEGARPGSVRSMRSMRSSGTGSWRMSTGPGGAGKVDVAKLLSGIDESKKSGSIRRRTMMDAPPY